MEKVWQKRHSLRKTPLSCGHQPTGLITQRFNPRYDAAAYRKAITRACGQAGIPQWHPHQLRHLATTNAAKKLNEDMAKAYIRHADKKMTRHYSIEAEKALAKEAALKIG